MKKIVIILILLAVISPVFAQQRTVINAETDMYYVNVPVEKIYPSRDGYVIMYRRNSTHQLGAVGIPNQWFYDSAGKAEMIRLPNGANWPSMSIFYKAGEFDLVRLYVHPVKSHVTWGSVPITADVSRYFADLDNFSIEY